MPPWGAVKGVGEFHGDPSLSLPEIDMFVAWVEGGAPEGDPALLPSRLPTVSAPTASLTGPSIEVATELKLKSATTVVALRPKALQDRQSLEAWATKPDGSVERLIWLKDYRAAWTRDYRLRTALRLPPGTQIRVSAPPGSTLLLFTR